MDEGDAAEGSAGEGDSIPGLPLTPVAAAGASSARSLTSAEAGKVPSPGRSTLWFECQQWPCTACSVLSPKISEFKHPKPYKYPGLPLTPVAAAGAGSARSLTSAEAGKVPSPGRSTLWFECQQWACTACAVLSPKIPELKHPTPYKYPGLPLTPVAAAGAGSARSLASAKAGKVLSSLPDI